MSRPIFAIKYRLICRPAELKHNVPFIEGADNTKIRSGCQGNVVDHPFQSFVAHLWRSELVIKGKLNASRTRCADRLGEACCWLNP